MPDATPRYGLPYPNDTDTLKAAVKAIPQTLAQQVESTIAGFGGIAAPGAWITPALGGGYLGPPSGYHPIQYRKVGQNVHLRGTTLRDGNAITAGSVLFTLPATFRPAATVVIAGDSAAAYTQLTIRADGLVVVGPNIPPGGNLSVLSPPIPLD